MEQRFVSIVIGGGIAGASFATALSREGARALVLERESIFKDRVRGEWLAPWGVAEMRALGLEEAFQRAGASELPFLAGRSLKPRPVRTPGGDPGLTFFHPVLQASLLRQAGSAGATIERGARVVEVSPGAHPTVQYITAMGRATATAPLIVGADGRSSLARKALGAHEQVHRSERVLAGARLAGVRGDPSVGYFIIREEEGALVSLFPQQHGFARAYIFHQPGTFAGYRGSDGEQAFLSRLVELGIPGDVVGSARIDGPLAAFSTEDSWVESPAGDSLALIGDAAGMSDPTWGMGIALALRDARTLAQALRSNGSQAEALAAYAAERNAYFERIIQVESWHTELQLTPGAKAAARRAHAAQTWREDPSRTLDLPGLGPDVDSSEQARLRFFGEDLTPVVTVAPVRPTLDVGDAFLRALERRDFDALAALFTEGVRTRALLPGGAVEVHGPGHTREAFEGWFAKVEDFRIILTDYGMVADRLRMSWRVSLRWPDESFLREIEQTAYAKVIDGRIGVFDLLCTGFRPQVSASSVERKVAA